ncbi:MAG TPA: hypothetical protein VGH42_08775 [Verrucomicrobiae bacterium]|jgi:hypothetical protein
MVSAAHRLPLICALALVFASVLQAKDLADYRVGDTAEADITATVALDVIDPAATATRKTEEARKTPAIFRSYPDTTNQVENEFIEAFAVARASFLAANKNILSQTNAAPDFAKLAADFNRENKPFPITADLAQLWARGDAGVAVQNLFVGRLREAMNRPIRADELPDGFSPGETLRLVSVSGPQETLTLNEAERGGTIVTAANVIALTRARAVLLQEFSDGEQPSARALAALLKPDCVFDENLTQQARARQVAGLAVAGHYDAGQVIVHRGDVVDSKILAALGQLRDKTLPDQLNQQIAAERSRTQQEHDQAQQEHTLAQQAQAQAQKSQTEAEREHEHALTMQQRAIDSQSQALQTRTHNEELITALAGVSVVTLLVLWRLARQRRKVSLLPATVLTPENRAGNNQVVLQNDLIPHLAQALKETLVQELAAQRGELLKAQQSATAEIAGLVRRLDELQSPMRERLRTYETQIQKLEKDLAEQNDENRELLKLKIEMIRRQLEAERERERVGFN